MQILHSSNARKTTLDGRVASLIKTISESRLRAWVEHIAAPRHFVEEAEQNRITAEWLAGLFTSSGYRIERQGSFCNIIAMPPTPHKEVILS